MIFLVVPLCEHDGCFLFLRSLFLWVDRRNGKRVVFLFHGITCSSADYVMNDPDQALGECLATFCSSPPLPPPLVSPLFSSSSFFFSLAPPFLSSFLPILFLPPFSFISFSLPSRVSPSLHFFLLLFSSPPPPFSLYPSISLPLYFSSNIYKSPTILITYSRFSSL